MCSYSLGKRITAGETEIKEKLESATLNKKERPSMTPTEFIEKYGANNPGLNDRIVID